MENTLLIETFYKAFAAGNADLMVNCYHESIEFEDPAFGKLQGEEAKSMWRMLVKRSQGQLNITHSHVVVDGTIGSCDWVAQYSFGKNKRKVVNRIHARFEFKDGKIIRHSDSFDLWKWSRQALGWKGSLLGWSAYMKRQIQNQSKTLLKAYMNH